jgi:hypothetical protein
MANIKNNTKQRTIIMTQNKHKNYLEEAKVEVVQISNSQRKKQAAALYNMSRAESLAYIEDRKLFPPKRKVLTAAEKIKRKKAQHILILGGAIGVICS